MVDRLAPPPGLPPPHLSPSPSSASVLSTSSPNRWVSVSSLDFRVSVSWIIQYHDGFPKQFWFPDCSDHGGLPTLASRRRLPRWRCSRGPGPWPRPQWAPWAQWRRWRPGAWPYSAEAWPQRLSSFPQASAERAPWARRSGREGLRRSKR